MNKKPFLIALVLILIIAAGLIGFIVANKIATQTITSKAKPEEIINDKIVAPLSPTEQPSDQLFNLSTKKSDTKLYVSENLGVGFTYDPIAADNTQVIVTEIDHTIYLHLAGAQPKDGQSIEVFTKDPSITLSKAIESQFLKGYNPTDCFVEIQEAGNSGAGILPNYITAAVSFPPTTDPKAPWWENGEKCPLGYSKTNGVSYFLYNQNVPNKYIFVSVGQDVITLDGTPVNPGKDFYGYGWNSSIRIIK